MTLQVSRLTRIHRPEPEAVERQGFRLRRHHAREVASEAAWGIWDIPEEELRLLPDVKGRDALDIGCGPRAYVRGCRDAVPGLRGSIRHGVQGCP